LVRHHDEDDVVLPIWKLPTEPAPPENLPRPTLLGGKTIGDELALIHDQMEQADVTARRDMQARLYSSNCERRQTVKTYMSHESHGCML